MSLPALYVLAGEYQEAAQRLSDTDLDEQTIADTLEGLRGDLEVKATNVAMVVRNMQATADAIKQAEQDMKRRREAIEHRAERLERYLLDNMKATGISRIDSPYMVVSIHKSPPRVVIDAESQLPAVYWRQKPAPPPEPDKEAIKQAIKEGAEVPGAHLEQGEHLSIK